MVREISGVKIECRQGDITQQKDCMAVVNAANAQLETGGGVAGAIHRAAGPGLAKEARALAPIKPGEAVITGGHELPYSHVIHCLGPVYGHDKPEDQLLANCYYNSLRIAEDQKITSVAFPAISTGAFGYPMEDAAKVAFKTVLETIPQLENVKKIVFVLHNRTDLELHDSVLNEILKEFT